MSKSNLTWPLTVAYLGVLVRNGMVEVYTPDHRPVYRITPKGSALLSTYKALQEAAAKLELDRLDFKLVSKAMSTQRSAIAERSLLESFTDLLKKSGRTTSTNTLKGASGATHVFDIVTTAAGIRTGFLILGKVSEVDVVRAFIMKVDCGIHVVMFCNEPPEKETSKLANSYGIEILGREDLAGSSFQLRAAALGRRCILEVDPDAKYEAALKDLAQVLVARNYALSVFTSKGSPLRSALGTMPEAKFYLMTPGASYQKETESPSEVLVPVDMAILLDTFEKIVKSTADRPVGLIFDTISDLILSSGFEATFKFMKRASEILSSANTTSVFLITAGAHEERSVRPIKNLFAAHLAFGKEGFLISKEL